MKISPSFQLGIATLFLVASIEAFAGDGTGDVPDLDPSWTSTTTVGGELTYSEALANGVRSSGTDCLLTTDADVDGVDDACDVCPYDATNDVDGDQVCGLDDDCPGVADPDQLDQDGDWQGDACDACPYDASNDADGDGWCADVDNCEAAGNAEQGDTDGDGQGDACDVCPNDPGNDADSDGVCGDLDNCFAVANSEQSDLDGDALGDACDPDDDGDAIDDAMDNCPADPDPTQADYDLDGIGDACDMDGDGDGLIDGLDACLGTALGDVVDATGCALADLAPCVLPPGARWKNHGAYVRAVAQLAQAFVAAALYTQVEMDAIVAAAAESSCGM